MPPQRPRGAELRRQLGTLLSRISQLSGQQLLCETELAMTLEQMTHAVGLSPEGQDMLLDLAEGLMAALAKLLVAGRPVLLAASSGAQLLVISQFSQSFTMSLKSLRMVATRQCEMEGRSVHDPTGAREQLAACLQPLILRSGLLGPLAVALGAAATAVSSISRAGGTLGFEMALACSYLQEAWVGVVRTSPAASQAMGMLVPTFGPAARMASSVLWSLPPVVASLLRAPAGAGPEGNEQKWRIFTPTTPAARAALAPAATISAALCVADVLAVLLSNLNLQCDGHTRLTSALENYPEPWQALAQDDALLHCLAASVACEVGKLLPSHAAIRGGGASGGRGSSSTAARGRQGQRQQQQQGGPLQEAMTKLQLAVSPAGAQLSLLADQHFGVWSTFSVPNVSLNAAQACISLRLAARSGSSSGGDGSSSSTVLLGLLKVAAAMAVPMLREDPAGPSAALRTCLWAFLALELGPVPPAQAQDEAQNWRLLRSQPEQLVVSRGANLASFAAWLVQGSAAATGPLNAASAAAATAAARQGIGEEAWSAAKVELLQWLLHTLAPTLLVSELPGPDTPQTLQIELRRARSTLFLLLLFVPASVPPGALAEAVQASPAAACSALEAGLRGYMAAVHDRQDFTDRALPPVLPAAVMQRLSRGLSSCTADGSGGGALPSGAALPRLLATCLKVARELPNVPDDIAFLPVASQATGLRVPFFSPAWNNSAASEAALMLASVAKAVLALAPAGGGPGPAAAGLDVSEAAFLLGRCLAQAGEGPPAPNPLQGELRPPSEAALEELLQSLVAASTWLQEALPAALVGGSSHVAAKALLRQLDSVAAALAALPPARDSGGSGGSGGGQGLQTLMLAAPHGSGDTLCQLLQDCGRAVSGAAPTTRVCNATLCKTLEQDSEGALVRGKGRCSACRSAAFCSQECSKAHWKAHKPWCKLTAQQRQAAAAAAPPPARGSS